MNVPARLLLLPALLIVAGCASLPNEPGVMVLPGTGRTFDQFRADEADCRDYAYRQIGGKSREEAANAAALGNAAIGTAIGAVAGAAIGGRSGAGAGAGAGLIVGSASGADAARGSIYGSQRRYDHAYVQCMYARGHRVPVNMGGYAAIPAQPPVAPVTPAAVPAAPPPPPPPAPPAGMPPPPPAR